MQSGDKDSPSISPAGRGQLVKTLITLEMSRTITMQGCIILASIGTEKDT